MSDMDWMKSPSVMVAGAIVVLLLIEVSGVREGGFASVFGSEPEVPTCLSYSTNQTFLAGHQKQDSERTRSFNSNDVRAHVRTKLLALLDQCTADACPGDLQDAVQKQAQDYFYHRSKDTIDEYERFGEPGLEALRWRYGTIDDNQIVSKLGALQQKGQIDISDWPYSRRSAARILMSGAKLEPCRAHSAQDEASIGNRESSSQLYQPISNELPSLR